MDIFAQLLLSMGEAFRLPSCPFSGVAGVRSMRADLAGYTAVGNLHGGPSTARNGGRWPADLAVFTYPYIVVGNLHGGSGASGRNFSGSG